MLSVRWCNWSSIVFVVGLNRSHRSYKCTGFIIPQQLSQRYDSGFRSGGCYSSLDGDLLSRCSEFLLSSLLHFGSLRDVRIQAHMCGLISGESSLALSFNTCCAARDSLWLSIRMVVPSSVRFYPQTCRLRTTADSWMVARGENIQSLAVYIPISHLSLCRRYSGLRPV